MTAVAVPRILSPKPTQGGAPSHAPPDVRYIPGNSLARFLGYFSLGLGMAELVAPREMGRLTGVRHAGLVQAYGVREIAAGLAILSSSRPTFSLWARVAGDALDLATLGANLVNGHGHKGRTWAAIAAVAGVTALDVVCAGQLSAASALTDD